MTLSQFRPPFHPRASAVSLAVAAAIAAVALTGCGSSKPHTSSSSATNAAATSPTITSGGFTSRVFATGAPIPHSTPKGKASGVQTHDPTKRGGHLLSKHRFLAAQFAAYLADDLWLTLARHAKRPEVETASTQFAGKLKPNRSKLQMEAPKDIPNLQVQTDSNNLEPAAFGLALPIDPGGPVPRNHPPRSDVREI